MERSSGAAPPPRSGGSGHDKPILSVHVEHSRDGASIVALGGELDLSTIPRMEAPLLEQLGQRRAVLLDLSGLSFIDSSGIGVLIQASRQSNGTAMHVLIGPDSHVERIFRIAGIGEALDVFSNREEALAALVHTASPNGDAAG